MGCTALQAGNASWNSRPLRTIIRESRGQYAQRISIPLYNNAPGLLGRYTKLLRCHSSPKQAMLETPEHTRLMTLWRSPLGHRPAPSDPLVYETLAVAIIEPPLYEVSPGGGEDPLNVLQFLLCLQAS